MCTYIPLKNAQNTVTSLHVVSTLYVVLILFIREKYKCEVRVTLVGFTDGEQIYAEVLERLKDLDIGILGDSHHAHHTIMQTHAYTLITHIHITYTLSQHNACMSMLRTQAG